MDPMTGTGVRKVGDLPDLSHLSREERIATLRTRMSVIEGGAHAAPQEEAVAPKDVIDVGERLRAILPGGGLARRAVTVVGESSQLVAYILAQATDAGLRAGVVGWPELAFASVDDMGGQLQRIVAVPEPGTHGLHVATVLSEGLDLVLYRHASQGKRYTIPPSVARPLEAKLRSGRAAFLLSGAHIAAPAATLEGTVTSFHGLARGSGRITGVDINVTVQARGHAPQATTLTVGHTPTVSAEGTIRVV
ncbi:Uncharacterised protein [Corynebacterium renale]|nr:Uncharacterised protein [Corynebacterium renale]STC94349.1 Uncharacterised protein [Corynebacterium renale]